MLLTLFCIINRFYIYIYAVMYNTLHYYNGTFILSTYIYKFLIYECIGSYEKACELFKSRYTIYESVDKVRICIY